MKKLVLLLVFIYLSNIDYAQILLPSMRALSLPIPSPKSIFKGGAGYTTQSKFLLQSSCNPVFVNNIFRGGEGYTSQSNSLLQSNCTPVYINNIFRGGEGYTSQSNSLLQSNCTPVYINNIFKGGEGNTIQSNTLLQSNCTPVYINNIFKGGSGFSSQNAFLLQSVNPPSITSQPSAASQTICQNSLATNLSVTATALGSNIYYKWYSNTTASNAGGTLINGATNNTFTPISSEAGTKYYYVVASNCGGSVTSNVSGAININPTPSIIASLGNALSFNGSNSYVAFSPSNNIDNLGKNSFTMEAMINGDLSNTKSIIRKTGDYNLFIINGHLTAEVWTEGLNHPNSWQWWYGNTTIANNSWTQVAAVWDGTSFSFYINGVLDQTSHHTGSISGSENLNIGMSANYGEDFNGMIDEVRIWNIGRSQLDIQNSMNKELIGNESGLVAYYNFNAGSDGANNAGITTLTDISGNNNNGLLLNFSLNGTTSNWVANTLIVSTDVSSSPQTISQNTSATTLSVSPVGSNLSYQWYNNTISSNTSGTLINGATNNTYAPPTSVVGTNYYYVVVSNSNGCSVKSSVSGAIKVE